MDDMGKNDSIPLDMLDGYGWFDMENPMENPKNSKWMRTGVDQNDYHDSGSIKMQHYATMFNIFQAYLTI
jgi:hypothetical protein